MEMQTWDMGSWAVTLLIWGGKLVRVDPLSPYTVFRPSQRVTTPSNVTLKFHIPLPQRTVRRDSSYPQWLWRRVSEGGGCSADCPEWCALSAGTASVCTAPVSALSGSSEWTAKSLSAQLQEIKTLLVLKRAFQWLKFCQQDDYGKTVSYLSEGKSDET